MEALKFGELRPEIFVAVGLLAFAINFVGTYEVQKVQEKDAGKAATAGAVGTLLGGILVYFFVENPFYAIPEVFGTFVGIYWQVKRSQITRRQINNEVKKIIAPPV